MKRILAALLAFGLIGGLALADSYSVGTGYEGAKPTLSSVTQDITVNIPHRTALHITETDWTLDLDVESSIAQYCKFISKVEMTNLGSWWEKAYFDGLQSAAGYGYPPINPAAITITDADKGYLVCAFSKTIQKFANSDNGWQIDVSLGFNHADGFGKFGISSFLGGGVLLFATTSVADDSVLLTYASPGGTTGGWLDSVIWEAFLFDGTEFVGTNTLELTFELFLP